jgi:hypothetical protein
MSRITLHVWADSARIIIDFILVNNLGSNKSAKVTLKQKCRCKKRNKKLVLLLEAKASRRKQLYEVKFVFE